MLSHFMQDNKWKDLAIMWQALKAQVETKAWVYFVEEGRAYQCYSDAQVDKSAPLKMNELRYVIFNDVAFS